MVQSWDEIAGVQQPTATIAQHKIGPAAIAPAVPTPTFGVTDSIHCTDHLINPTHGHLCIE